jgi:hypothetical protein
MCELCYFDAFSSREPVSTSLENALAEHRSDAEKVHTINFVHTCRIASSTQMMTHNANRERHMKHFMIRYEFKNGTTEAWHQEVGRFIKAIDGDPELKGRIGYRVLKNRDNGSYFHLASVSDDAAQKALQSRDFFKAYQEMTRKVAGGEVTATPLEWIGATA